jgi:hypothetical protein
MSEKPLPQAREAAWLVGEALSNLLVGLQRFRRGERIAAMRMVQVYVLDRLMELIDLREAGAEGVRPEPFNADRRFEFRHPDRAALVAAYAVGIDATPRAAMALLSALQEMADVLDAMARQIEMLA